jgi:MFS family permease
MNSQQSPRAPGSPIFFWALTSALAGFLFGFDTVVISGAEKRIQELWDLNGSAHGWALSAALWGTVLGAMFGGWPANRFGRKGTLLWIGIFYLVSALFRIRGRFQL